MNEFLQMLLLMEADGENGGDGEGKEEGKTGEEETGGDPAPKKETPDVKTFTQEEIDNIVVSRLAKQKQSIMKKLGIEDENQLDDVVDKYGKYDEVAKENQQLKLEKETKQRIDIIKDTDVDDDFVEFVLEKVEKGETLDDFKKNVADFIEKNPKFKKENFSTVDSSVGVKGEPYPDFTKMTPEQYLAWRAKNSL